jgi:DNA-binding transcriptional MerR regulator
MEKTVEAFRTIGEVAVELDLPQHVLRFWETKFTQIRPVKRAGGRRYYRPEDVQLVAAIRVMLYSEGYTIKGVQRILKEQGVRAVLSPTGVRAEPGAANRTTPAPVSVARVATPREALALQEALSREEALALDAAPPEREGAVLLEAISATGTRLSAQDRHRLEAILAELTECARLLA